MSYTKSIFLLFVAASALLILLITGSCQNKQQHHRIRKADDHLIADVNHRSNMPFDSTLLQRFYQQYPSLEKYRNDAAVVYRKHNFTCIWYDEKGIIEFGQTLYSKSLGLETEGVTGHFPEEEKVDGIFENSRENTLSQAETDIMITNLYLYYAEKVYRGLHDTITTGMGWLLPRKQVEYSTLLDSLLSDQSLIYRDDSSLIRQYYRLRDHLYRYREIARKGGWKPIEVDTRMKWYKPGDTAAAILQIRQRLAITGELKQDNGSPRFDAELAEGLKQYLKHNGFNPSEKILPEHIRSMNVPVDERIRQIMVNMERCRWISPEFARAREFITVNIPSYTLSYIRDGSLILQMPVVVGKNVTKTVIFSGMLSYIVFSPYWNVPPSILRKEIRPGIAKDPNYLAKHNMEWNDGQVRQKPGKNNSLGLVKFIFPNSNDIYMHDTPAKSLFAQEKRAFSHGCIRVGKPRDLAIAILQDNPEWTPERIDRAMNAGRESTVILKEKIPVYIGYFTAWVGTDGELNFYEDVYKRDESLAVMIMAPSGQL